MLIVLTILNRLGLPALFVGLAIWIISQGMDSLLLMIAATCVLLAILYALFGGPIKRRD